MSLHVAFIDLSQGLSALTCNVIEKRKPRSVSNTSNTNHEGLMKGWDGKVEPSLIINKHTDRSIDKKFESALPS